MAVFYDCVELETFILISPRYLHAFLRSRQADKRADKQRSVHIIVRFEERERRGAGGARGARGAQHAVPAGVLRRRRPAEGALSVLLNFTADARHKLRVGYRCEGFSDPRADAGRIFNTRGLQLTTVFCRAVAPN
ncbi:hypothetical protein EVAR_27844_1 [Eumeta japonica]|uniref:Uncharacterized protein n=1 Tax=Eumeta variegata TaxID=151549 RepID=A0A4C1VK32_EUMVA|nr:hypothetical protein EVAR_27844_1 [Eumeta japonica]